jgi:hypothetical protein
MDAGGIMHRNAPIDNGCLVAGCGGMDAGSVTHRNVPIDNGC